MNSATKLAAKTILKRGAFVALFVVGLVAIFIVYVLHMEGPSGSKQVVSGAYLIDRAGGADRINDEAQTLLAIYGSKPFDDLGHENFYNYLAFAALGNVMVWVAAETTELPKHLVIRYGNHWDYEYIYVLGAKAPVASNWPGAFQIRSNIFVTKK